MTEFENLILVGSNEDKMRYCIKQLEHVNTLLDEAYEAHLKEVSRRATLSGKKVKETFGNK